MQLLKWINRPSGIIVTMDKNRRSGRELQTRELIENISRSNFQTIFRCCT